VHDLGKIGIPDAILLKRGRLTEEEFAIMRTHPQIGYEILRDSPSRFIQLGASIALHHHERWDGTGYPHGLSGEDIPRAARIVALADVFDALLSERPYKSAWSHDEAVAYVRAHSGSFFDPACVSALLRDMSAVIEIEQTRMTEPVSDVV
jgi:Response regulator containing a CheY-like receiver domain and an HD-GYP domain